MINEGLLWPAKKQPFVLSQSPYHLPKMFDVVLENLKFSERQGSWASGVTNGKGLFKGVSC